MKLFDFDYRHPDEYLLNTSRLLTPEYAFAERTSYRQTVLPVERRRHETSHAVAVSSALSSSDCKSPTYHVVIIRSLTSDRQPTLTRQPISTQVVLSPSSGYRVIEVDLE